jgi:hypothetical protein
MRWVIAIVAVIGCGGGASDDCTKIKDKVRPLLDGMAREAGKEIPEAKRDELLAEFCAMKDSTESEKKLYRCLLDASDQPAAAACLQTEFEAYAKPSPRPARDAAVAVGVPDAAVAAVVADAAVADAAPPKPAATPVDPQSLPELAVPSGVTGKGPPVEVYAVDMDGDQLLEMLATDDLIALPANKRVTGRISAPSRQAGLRRSRRTSASSNRRSS